MSATTIAPAATSPTKLELPENARQPLFTLRNEGLAETADLYSQVQQAHWNVKGPAFFQLHQLFDQPAAELFPLIDLVEERATALGGVMMGTVRMAAAASALPEYPRTPRRGKRT